MSGRFLVVILIGGEREFLFLKYKFDDYFILSSEKSRCYCLRPPNTHLFDIVYDSQFFLFSFHYRCHRTDCVALLSNQLTNLPHTHTHAGRQVTCINYSFVNVFIFLIIVIPFLPNGILTIAD